MGLAFGRAPFYESGRGDWGFMWRYVLRRLVLVLPVLIGVSIVVFWMVRAIPGDPAAVLAGEAASEEVKAELRSRLGLDEHPVIQYTIFVSNAIKGDFGRSIRSKRPVVQDLKSRAWPTLELSFGALAVALSIGLVAGILSAVKPYTLLDAVSMFIALIGVSMPVFWLGLMLILKFSHEFKWLPTAGRGTWRHLILPAVTLGLSSAAIIARMTRASMLEVLRQDYVRTARAKGLRERIIVLRHGLRNALIPIVTVIGLQFGTMLGGAVLTETVFAWPGMGRLLVDSIAARDYPVVQGAILVLACAFIFINLLVDVLYAYIDPTIRYD